jgi:hypothetical protein
MAGERLLEMEAKNAEKSGGIPISGLGWNAVGFRPI